MDKLTGDQKAEYATSLAALALYDGGVSFLVRPSSSFIRDVIFVARPSARSPPRFRVMSWN